MMGTTIAKTCVVHHSLAIDFKFERNLRVEDIANLGIGDFGFGERSILDVGRF